MNRLRMQLLDGGIATQPGSGTVCMLLIYITSNLILRFTPLPPPHPTPTPPYITGPGV
jgi:hypothetical protein